MTMTQNEKMVRAQQSLSPKTDRELAQAYSQGYQDGRRGLEELIAALRLFTDPSVGGTNFGDDEMTYIGWFSSQGPTALERLTHGRAALAKVAQPQPATKGE